MFYRLLLFCFILFPSLSFGQLQYVNSGVTADLTFVEMSEVYGVSIAGGSSIRKSLDNGLTWQACGTFSSAPIFKEGVILGTNKFIVCGRLTLGTNRLFSTTNGGSTWTVCYSGDRLNGIDNNGDTVVTVGDNGRIIRSLDGGTTWTIISSGTTEDLFDIAFDVNLNKWVIGGSEGTKFTSTNSLCSSVTATVVADRFVSLNFDHGYMIQSTCSEGSDYQATTVLKKFGDVVVDSFYTEVQSVKAYNLPNQDIFLISSSQDFMYYNTIDNELYFIQDSIHNNQTNYTQQPNDIGTTSTALVCAGNNGSMGRTMSFNTWQYYLPADFTWQILPGCPGTSFTTSTQYGYADSIAWYIDNQFYSSNDTVTVVYPANGITHELKLVLEYDGITTSEAMNFTSDFYNFPTYSMIIDTSLCYDQPVTFKVKKTGGGSASGVSVRMMKDNTVIYGPAAAPASTSSYINLSGGILSVGDTVTLEFFKNTANCGEQKVSFSRVFTVGPNLENTHLFQLMDSVICLETDTVAFDLASEIVGINYQVMAGGTQILNISSVSDDTLHYEYPSSNFYSGSLQANGYPSPETTTMLTLTVNYDGCTKADQNPQSFTVYNTTPYFDFYDAATQVGDTIQLENQLPNDYSNWRITPLTGTFNNTTSIEPVIASSTVGSFSITLVNEHEYGCKDSITKVHHIVDGLAPEQRSVCYDSTSVFSTIFESIVDKNGNYVEYGYYYFDDWSTQRTIPVIRKLDPNGHILWSKFPFQKSGIVRCSDVDDELNTYAALDISSSGAFESIQVPSGGGKYIVKWNHQGAMVDFLDLSFGYPYSDAFILDIVVDSESHLIYYVSATKIVTLDWSLNFVESTPIVTGELANNFFYTGSSAQSLSVATYDFSSPKIKLLPNGEIVLLADLKPESGVVVLGQFTINTDQSGDEIVVAARYHHGEGFTSAKRIMTIRNASNEEPFIKDLDVDNSGNIYFISNPHANPPFGDNAMIYAGNELIEATENFRKSFLVKLNDSLDIVWLRNTNLREGFVNYSSGTNQLYLSGIFRKHMYVFGDDDYFGIDGKIQDNVDIYGNPKYMEYGYLILDTTGMAVTGQVLSAGLQDEVYSDVYRRHKLVSSVNSCGVLYLNFNSKVDWVYQNNPLPLTVEIDNNTYVLNGSTIFKITDGICMDNCPYFAWVSNDTVGVCPETNLSVEYDFDGVTFDSLYVKMYDEQGQLTFEGNVPDNNGSFEIDSDNQGGYLLVINPVDGSANDTLFFEILTPISPQIFANYEVPCGDSLLLTIESMGFSDIVWSNSSDDWNDSAIILNSQNLLVNDTTFFTVEALDSNSCFTTTSFDVVYCNYFNVLTNDTVLFCQESGFQIDYEGEGFDSLSISIFDEFDQLHFEGNIAIDAGHFEVHPMNQIGYVLVQNPLNELITDTVFFEVLEPVAFPVLSNYSIACEDSLVLSVNDDYFSNVVWMNSMSNWISNSLTLNGQNTLLNDTTFFTVEGLDSNSCVSTSSFTVVYCYDLQLAEEMNFVSIFPNPSSGIVWIELTEDMKMAISITDAFGSKLAIPIERVDIELYKLDITKLATGVYFIRITPEASKYSTRSIQIVKQ